jgi:hypothetical protein
MCKLVQLHLLARELFFDGAIETNFLYFVYRWIVKKYGDTRAAV